MRLKMENKPKYIPISGTKFVRDTDTGAILNTDKLEFNNYNAQREIRMKEQIEKEQIKGKINQIESDIQDIKNMIMELSKARLTNGN